MPAREWPDEVAAVAAWIRRLRAEHGNARAGLAVHRSSDPGHWIVTFPWTGAERARAIADAALALTERNVSPIRTARLTGTQAALARARRSRIDEASTTPPPWIRDVDRRSRSCRSAGRTARATVTRLITHILLRAGRHVGTTTSDGVLVDERMIEPGDWTGPGGAHQILARSDIDVAVLETARGGIVLRGVGYESNDASILTNVSSDHLDLQGIHTLPELAEVKATICRITQPDGWVVLNGDDPLVAAARRRVRAHVALFSLDEAASPVVRRHVARGGRRTWSGAAAGRGRGRAGEDDRARGRDPIAIGGIARTTWRTRLRRQAEPGRSGRRSPRWPTACATSGRPPIARPAGSTCSGSAAGSSSSTSRTTKRASRPSSTSPRGSPGARRARCADHRDHRHRRRPAR